MATLKSPLSIIKEWSYDVVTDSYRHISGITVDRTAIDRQGGDLESALDDALKMSQKSNMAPVGVIGAVGTLPPQYPNSLLGAHMPYPSQPSTFTIGNLPNANNFVITTDKGTITLNLKTGDITFPLELGRDEAIRDFWMGFQLHFGAQQDSKFKNRIKELEDECYKLKTKLKETEQAADEYKKYVHEKTIKGVVDKISKKYSNEKFIMTKPADLIKMIEEA